VKQPLPRNNSATGSATAPEVFGRKSSKPPS
jgi:hypothetical protein